MVSELYLRSLREVAGLPNTRNHKKHKSGGRNHPSDVARLEELALPITQSRRTSGTHIVEHIKIVI